LPLIFFRYKREKISSKKMIKEGSYETNRWVFWFLWGFVIVWSILLLFWIGVYVQNNGPAYTWFKTAGSLGTTLFSLRDSFVAILVRMGIVSCIAIPFIVCALIGLRTTSYIPFALFIIASILTFFAFSALSDQYVNCNGANQYGNLCNDAKYGTFGAELAPNDDFIGLYWMIVVFLLLEWAFIAVLVVLRITRGANRTGEEEDASDDNEKATEESPPPPPPENALVTALASSAMRSTPMHMHNLRKRVK
jgi:hypothetical protein